MKSELTPKHRQKLNSLRAQFCSLPDSREAGKVKHSLPDVLMCALCAMICGFENYTAMGTFAKLRIDWLREFLSMENGAPSHDTFRNVFGLIRPDCFAAVLGDWIESLAGEHVAIDGKALRGTFDRDTRKCMVHLLRAWVDDISLSAGQVACAKKSNEIEAIPRLLDLLQLSGATVTIDAAGCQTAIAKKIDDADASYILCLKGNQGEAHKTVKEHFESTEFEAKESMTTQTEELSHGRYEKRTCVVEKDLSFFDKSWKWAGLQCVARIQRETCRPETTDTERGESMVEDQYYLCSVEADPENILNLVRKHWGIENRCHWMLDVVFSEDACPVRDRCAAQNLSITRELALHLLQAHPLKGSLPTKRQHAVLDSNILTEIISKIHA